MKVLCIIPARRDSRGIPGKNWKLLNNIPLVGYSIDIAKQSKDIDEICISTNSDEVIEIATNHYHLKVPFTRPEELSLDTTSSHDVLIHAVEFYESQGKTYDAILLLQPTSPFRKVEFINECIEIFKKSDCDMVVSVCETPLNPYYNLYNETDGFIHRSIQSNFTRRQDCPKTYLVNGSIYVISVNSLKNHQLHEMKKVIKYEMPEEFSVDLDTLNDWEKAEKILIKQ
jgi:CMP-N,N'-diacetyllegionaminic acid synthase